MSNDGAQPAKPIRERVKEHFPTVLLTLLSIVQALALELLWSHIVDTSGRVEPSAVAVAHWLQIGATFLGIVLIWVIYVSTVMRFRWVPTTSDSIFPFITGVLEFLLIELLGPANLGAWFLALAMLFGQMSWISHATMKRARLDPDNETFFRTVTPARLGDFLPDAAIITSLALTGIFFLATISINISIVALLGVIGLFGLQLRIVAKFWERSVRLE